MDLHSAIDKSPLSIDRLLWRRFQMYVVILIIAYLIFGFVSNYWRTVYNNETHIVEQIILQFFMIGTIQLAALLFIINFAHLRVNPTNWGFIFGRGFRINLIISAITTIPLLATSGLGFAIQDFFLPFRIVGATVEELVFRVFLICMFIS